MEMVSTTAAASSSSLLSGAYLVWEELTAVLPNSGSGQQPKRLLNRLSGYASPGQIMAIMGPSGSGKSTLLDSLAGRLGRNVVLSGNVLLNGKKRRADYGNVAYVTQEDVLLCTLTVREYISYSAQLRFPTSMARSEVAAAVEAAIEGMGLQECADRPVGNWHLRGISGGERKRLSIALETLTRPRLLFLDEPTSGLDSAAAFFVIQTLRQMAVDGDKTVVSSVHQPSSEVFALFDHLFLLSAGEAVYFGDAKTATEFFAEVGFPCPSRRNPSDHFLRCINSDFDQVISTLQGSMKSRMDIESPLDPLSKWSTSEIKDMLIESYKSSNYATTAKRRIQEILKIEGLTAESDEGSQATWWKQLTTLTRRSFANMSRDVGYYWMRIAVYAAVSVCVGSVFYDIGTAYTSIMGRAACGAFVSGFMTFLSVGGFPSFVEELRVSCRERRNGYYGAGAYVASNCASSFPFVAATAAVSGAIACSMVKDRGGYEHYAYFIASLFVGVGVVESIMMIVASLVPNFMMGIITGSGVIGVMMMAAGFFRLLPELPKVFWRYPVSYINYASWGLQGNLKDAFLGLEFDPMVPGDPKLSGEYVVEHVFGIGLDRSKWFDLLAMFVVLVAYRIFFFLVLKSKEGAAPLLRTMHTKVATLRQIARRPRPTSTIRRRTPSFSSWPPSLRPSTLQEGPSSSLA